jgi:hypothetical protein
MRRALIGATVLLVAGTTTACGGAPGDASTDDFCQAIQDLPGGDEPSQEEIDDYLDELEGTGTPEGISEDARKGFETWVDVIGDIDVDDSPEEIQEMLDDEAEGDREKEVDALFTYVARTCAGS